jgi:four helix bundle protein
MTNESPNPKSKRSGAFDLEDRTAAFGEAVIRFVRSVPIDVVTESLVRQLVRAATSVGANYCEANDAGSKKEFRHRIGISRKEAKEAKHWLRMIVTVHEPSRDAAKGLWQEANGLNLIFSAIIRNSKSPTD